MTHVIVYNPSSVLVQASRLKNGVCSCTTKTRYINLKVLHPFYASFALYFVLHSFYTHLSDRFSQIFKKFARKLKKRLNVVLVKIR